MDTTILEMREITKRFPGVKALDKVSLNVKRGEIHTLVGENGAGKSTLMKVLSGVYGHTTYEGDVFYQGKLQQIDNIRDSEALGIIIIHQELALVPQMSIAENIFLGNEQANYGVMDWELVRIKAQQLLKKVGLRESVDTLITNCGVGKQQLVEIAKALSKDVKLLILDEPTASLNERDSDALMNLLLEFKTQGITSILISHKLNEIAKVADSVTIIRDGATIETLDCSTHQVSEERIIKGMVGRELTERYPKRNCEIGEVAFALKDWTVYHSQHKDLKVVDNIKLSVKKGEVVGIAGLMGAGRTELAMSAFGRSYGQNISGTAFIDGTAVDLSTIEKAMDNGLAYVTEDRKECGLLLEQSIDKNISLANLGGISNRGLIDQMQEMSIAKTYQRKINIKCANTQQDVGNLSGGNQQKVVLSKWLFTKPKVLILDEPTRGIDVGAKYEIYGIINELAEQGKAVIVISSEMPELLGICDRIYVINEGAVVGEMPAADASQEKIMRAIMNSGDKQ